MTTALWVLSAAMRLAHATGLTFTALQTRILAGSLHRTAKTRPESLSGFLYAGVRLGAWITPWYSEAGDGLGVLQISV